ncbi:uncharacterized membrane protein YcaP (DUF421 family) [Virgibacillus natechei]|uniref:Uncharacterized membrane protein YcaP (DUF421 family) n=1 Tax=Virgibacillus natechei TaxID=1216297 RepID=A0ABS4ILI7_9BACI|nr:DUF421 domain-containing protein [Virgibacillus natechei]MBP1971775.1 uncharacterized membrane protein YcaP (DUF421 family) [Virgibacillus natechei]UZD12895.1 DUF421 domain-containing protein [Virgibacillus natechei]
MIELLKEILVVLGRILTILPLLLVITLFMGKRAIGEFPIFDFLIIVTLASIVGADIADPSVDHIPTAIAVIAIGIFQKIITKWKIANRKIGKLLTFEPTVVIQEGKFVDKNLKQMRYSIDNILQMLREKDVFDMSEVETAIIEANGELSVLKTPQKHPITVEDMQISKTTSPISFPVIVEGATYTTVLKEFSVDEAWLQQQLSDQGVTDIEHVFFASINRQLALHISLKNEHISIPTIRH